MTFSLFHLKEDISRIKLVKFSFFSEEKKKNNGFLYNNREKQQKNDTK